jgi:DNA-binding NtrC family response regulator
MAGMQLMLTETQRTTAADAAGAAVGPRENSGAGEKSAVHRVLVIDDEPLIRWSLAQTLEGGGYSVVTAVNGAQGIRELLEKGPFDAVLLDLQLPDCGDLGLLRMVRDAAPTTPVVLMTAFLTPEAEEEAGWIGAARILRKPFDLTTLIPLLDILGRNERSDDSRR